METINRLYRPGFAGPGEDLAETELAVEDEPLIAWRAGADDEAQRLDRVLARHFPQYSRSHWQRQIESGRVRIDGLPASSRTLVRAGQTIAAEPMAPESEQTFAAEPVVIDVIDEDEALIVIDKPAGLVVHPAAGHWHGTLMQGLMYRWPELAQMPRAGIVHRLDKDTSGLMVVAKTAMAQFDLVRQLQARSMGREYLAIVEGALGGQAAALRTRGKPQDDAGQHADLEVDAPIGRDRRNRLRMAVCSEGKPAITRVGVLAHGRLVQHRPCSLVHCRLATGRTHQIRVHMAHLGHPLVGDGLYGGRVASPTIERQALHAFRLRLQHPADRALRAWTAPPPEDFMRCLQACAIDVGQAWARLKARVEAGDDAARQHPVALHE